MIHNTFLYLCMYCMACKCANFMTFFNFSFPTLLVHLYFRRGNKSRVFRFWLFSMAFSSRYQCMCIHVLSSIKICKYSRQWDFVVGGERFCAPFLIHAKMCVFHFSPSEPASQPSSNDSNNNNNRNTPSAETVVAAAVTTQQKQQRQAKNNHRS